MRSKSEVRESLIQIILSYRIKPYLPIYGELFHVLRQIKLLALKERESILLYSIFPQGTFSYDYHHQRFVAVLNECNIYMNEHDYILSIINHRILPVEVCKKGLS